jgi:hypothetical protein
MSRRITTRDMEQAEKDVFRRIQKLTDRRQDWDEEDRLIRKKRQSEDNIRKFEDQTRREYREDEIYELENELRKARDHLHDLQRVEREPNEEAREKPYAKSYTSEQPDATGMTFWEEVEKSQRKDRETHGVIYDRFAKATKEFMQDNSKGFPRIRVLSSCDREKCVTADKLRICQHDLEDILRGSGRLTKAWLKTQRIQWHTDKWVGKGKWEQMATEMFQLHQAILDAGEAKDSREYRESRKPRTFDESTPKDSRGRRDFRDAEDHRELRDSKNYREPKDFRDSRDSRDPKDFKYYRNFNDRSDSRHFREYRDAREYRNPREYNPRPGESSRTW